MAAAQAQVNATPKGPATLPQFTWVDTYEALRVALWPVDGGTVEGESDRGEPPALRGRIETLTPDDGWLTRSSKKSDSDAMGADSDDSDVEGEGGDSNDGEDVAEGPAGIRYINLEAHPALAINELGLEVDRHHNKATFAVRHEYDLFMEHAMSRLSDPPDDSYCARFFVTGQSGIGKSFGCYYFLFRLLALGQSVFFVNSPTIVYYFTGNGVQKTNEKLENQPEPATTDALRVSWVLIDMDDKSDWVPPKIFNCARCVVWTSPPLESRMKKFRKRFGAERWYMKAWSSKEIAAVTERLAIDHAELLKRLDTGGSVARSLWGGEPVPSPQTIDDVIKNALSGGNIFASTPMEPVHCVFLIQPLVVIDEESGRACLQRTNYSAEFISAHMAHRTLDLAQHHLETVQGQLAAALDISTTRSVAEKLFEGMMHRALTRGMKLPAVFGSGTVAGTLELIDKGGSFVCGTDKTDIPKERPLYLQLESFNFAAVNMILVTHEKLGFIKASPGDSHRRDFGMLLRIMSRLPRGAQVDVSSLGEVIYCLVGTVYKRVQKLVAEAKGTLAELKTFDAQKLGKELRMRHTKIAHARLSTFRVVGCTFDHKQGFTEVR
ncbi:hypothetical protein B0H11DRAFT_2061930 [Mycena galericulata]|nr:hypothetical protein B0H11DRAFT_2061930 [Mycena galericulata]